MHESDSQKDVRSNGREGRVSGVTMGAVSSKATGVTMVLMVLKLLNVAGRRAGMHPKKVSRNLRVLK